MDPRAQLLARQDRGDVLFEILGLAFLDDEDRFLVGTETRNLAVEQRIGNVKAIDRNVGVAELVGQAEQDHSAVQRRCTCRLAR